MSPKWNFEYLSAHPKNGKAFCPAYYAPSISWGYKIWDPLITATRIHPNNSVKSSQSHRLLSAHLHATFFEKIDEMEVKNDSIRPHLYQAPTQKKSPYRINIETYVSGKKNSWNIGQNSSSFQLTSLARTDISTTNACSSAFASPSSRPPSAKKVPRPVVANPTGGHLVCGDHCTDIFIIARVDIAQGRMRS